MRRVTSSFGCLDLTDGRRRNALVAGFIAVTSEEHHDDVRAQMTDEFVTSADSS